MKRIHLRYYSTFERKREEITTAPDQLFALLQKLTQALKILQKH